MYCSCVSTRWQWSVNLYKNSKETAVCKMRNNTQTQNTQNRKKKPRKHETQHKKY